MKSIVIGYSLLYTIPSKFTILIKILAEILKEVKPMISKPMLSVKDLSQKLRISLPKAYELVRTKIPHIKVGARILIDEEILNTWIKENSKL